MNHPGGEHIPSYVRSRRAAYRALATFRIKAAARDVIAAKVSDILGELPEAYMAGLIAAGDQSGIAGDLIRDIPSYVATDRRREAAGAAVVAAATAIRARTGRA
jgi:hypothetical protein